MLKLKILTFDSLFKFIATALKIILPVKICVGYSDEENNSMCQSNNTSKSMTKKSFTSKDWEHLINPLKSIGYTLLNKYQKNPTKGEFVINIHNEPFLNVLSSHVSKKPWIKGSEKISSDVLDILNLKTLLQFHENYKLSSHFQMFYI